MALAMVGLMVVDLAHLMVVGLVLMKEIPRAILTDVGLDSSKLTV